MRVPSVKKLPAVARGQIRRPIFWIVLFCLVLRLFFVLSDAPTPVQFDARIYVSCALVLPLTITHPSLLFDEAAREKISYDLVYADRLRGETVAWLYYSPPGFTEALESVFFAGPVYPALLGAIIWPDWGNDFAAARVANAVFDAVSCALLFWILTMTAGRAAALLGSVFFALYPGFIIKCGDLTMEALSVMLVLLSVALCVSAVCHDRRGRFFGAGAVAAVLLLTRAASSITIFFLGLAVIVVFWNDWRRLLKSLSYMTAGFVVFTLPWVILVWSYYGEPDVRDPTRKTASFRSSNVLADRGYDLDIAREDFWTYPVGREIINRPGEYFQLYVEKFYRLWNRSYNDYRIPLLVGVDAQTWFHRLLIIPGIIGLFFWPARFSRYTAWFALAIIVNVAFVHTLWHSLTRYALVAMPLVLGSAGVGLVAVAGRFRSRLSFSRWGALGLAALLTYLAWDWLSAARILAIGESWSPETANILVVVIRALVLTGDLVLVGHLLGWSRRVWWFLGVVFLAGQTILWVKSIPRERWAEWSVELCHPTQAVERVVHLPPGYDWGIFERVLVSMDIQSGGGEKFTLHLKIDTMHYSFPGGTYTKTFYPKGSYEPFLEAYGMKKEEVRHWVTFGLDRETITQAMEDDKLEVRLWVTEGDAEKNYIRVYGDYRPADWAFWVGPTLFNPAVERLYEEDDPRIWEPISRELVDAENLWIESGKTDDHDLSPAPGLQTGDYRMIVVGMIASRNYVFF